MKKQLALMERVSIRDFATANAACMSSSMIRKFDCQALLNVLATSFVSILKHDMCKGGSRSDNLVFNVVNRAFTMEHVDIDAYFGGLGRTNKQFTKSL